MSGNAVRKNAPTKIVFFSWTCLAQIGHKYLCPFFRNQTFPPEVVYVCSLGLLHLKSIDKHLFFLHFHMTTVTLVNFILMCLQKRECL